MCSSSGVAGIETSIPISSYSFAGYATANALMGAERWVLDNPSSFLVPMAALIPMLIVPAGAPNLKAKCERRSRLQPKDRTASFTCRTLSIRDPLKGLDSHEMWKCDLRPALQP